MYDRKKFDLNIGDLVKIYAPLSRNHGFYALIVDGPNVYGVYTVLLQEDMTKRNYAYGELERVN